MFFAALLCTAVLGCGNVSTALPAGGTAAAASSSTGSNSGAPAGGGATPPTSSEPADPTGPGIFNVKLAPWSATGDGVTDDTLAIRSAIAAACTAGGGEVWFPKGTYIISPQSRSEIAALSVSCDNITLAGAGMGLSVLSRKTLGDTDPDRICPMNGGEVNRGMGIAVTHKAEGNNLRVSFHMQDLSLLGNRKAFTGQNGGHAWPATQTNCFDVWDISDKGLFVDWDATDVQVLRTEIAYFSGELFYGGGQNSTNWVLTGSNLHHSNGDGLSVTAGVDVERNQIHDVSANGVENQPYGAGETQYFIGNSIYNVGLDGIGLLQYAPSFYNAPLPKIEVASNLLTNVTRYGITVLSRGASIHDNQVYDSGVPGMMGCGIAVMGTQGSDGSWLIPQNMTIQNNTVEARNVTTRCGIWVYTAAQAGVTAFNVAVTGNTLGPMKASATNGVSMQNGIIIQPGTQQVTQANNTLH